MPNFLGATLSRGSMTSTPDLSQFAFLFEDWALRRAPQLDPLLPPDLACIKAEQPVTFQLALNGPADLAGTEVTINMRGSYIGTAGSGSGATVTFNGRTETVTLTCAAVEQQPQGMLPLSGGEVFIQLKAPAVEGQNMITVTLSLAPRTGPDETHTIEIETIDVATP